MLKNVKNFKRFRGGKSKIKNKKMISSPVGSSICYLQPYDTVGGSGVKSPEETKQIPGRNKRRSKCSFCSWLSFVSLVSIHLDASTGLHASIDVFLQVVFPV